MVLITDYSMSDTLHVPLLANPPPKKTTTYIYMPMLWKEIRSHGFQYKFFFLQNTGTHYCFHIHVYLGNIE